MDFAIYGPMMNILTAFKAEHPLVKLSLRSLRSDDQSSDLAAHRLDVAFTIRHRFPRDLELLQLTREPLVAVMSRDHKLARKKRVSIEDFADEPFIMGGREGWQFFLPIVEAFCSNAGFVPRVVFEAEGTVIFKAVANKLGITIYPSCARNAEQAGLVVKDFVEDPPVIETFGIIRSSGYPPIVAKLIASLREIVEGSTSNVGGHLHPASM